MKKKNASVILLNNFFTVLLKLYVSNLQICLTDEVMCKIMSKSIIEIKQMSKNREFEKRIREILQVMKNS